MAQIPLGEFGAARVTPQASPNRVDTSATNIAGRGAGAIADALGQGGDTLNRIASTRDAEDKRKSDALAQAEMVNAGTDYEIQIGAAAREHAAALAEGRVDFRKADEAWAERTAKIPPPPPPPGLDEAMTVRFGGVLRQTTERARLTVTAASRTAQQSHFKAQVTSALDNIVMVAAQPGASTEEAIARVQALAPQLRMADFDEATTATVLTKAQEKIYGNEVQGRLNVAANDRGALDALLGDLEGKDGRYMTRLEDPTTRMSYAGKVRQRLHQLDTAERQTVDKREAIGKQAVAAMWKQATSGVPWTPATVQQWSTDVAGTSHEAEFKAAGQMLVEVQGVLRQPKDAQADYVQALRVKLAAEGGLPEDKARIDQLETMIAGVAKQREEEPLLYLAAMTGTAPKAIDLNAVLQSGDLRPLGQMLEDNMADVTALRGQFGGAVQKRPLLAQDAEGLAGLVNALPPSKVLPLFKALRGSGVSDDTYAAVMQQIAPNAPLKAYAGELSARPGGEPTAFLMLAGEAVLAGKGDVKMKMPPDASFQEALTAAAGNAYQGRPDAFTRDLAAIRAVYAGAAVKDGNTAAGDAFDPALATNAIRAVVGNVAEFGGRKVVVPWGMAADVFTDRAEELVAEKLQAIGTTDTAGIGLMATPRPGVYVLTRGRAPIEDPTASRPLPLFIDLNTYRAPTTIAPKAVQAPGVVVPAKGLR